MRRWIVTVLVALMAVGAPSPALAYLKFGVRVGDRSVDVKWNTLPVQYFVTERGSPGVSGAAFLGAVNRAFATWQAVSTTSVRAEFQGSTIIPPGFQDGRSTLGFLDREDLPRVLGATSFLLDEPTGAILEADVFFNTRFAWSTAAAGEQGRVDVESVALHEIGHLLGLGHSALGETEMIAGGRRVIASGAVMFPVAMSAGSIADRVVQPDDIAGISDLYPASGFREHSGSISGRVTKDGAGVFGAHLEAFNVETGHLVGGFSLNDRGEFVLGALAAGAYIVRAEPLDDVDVEGFFSQPIDVEFRPAYAARLIVVPEGGASSGPITIAVGSK